MLAIESRYPIHTFFYDIVHRLAPRLLKWNKWFSDVAYPTRSIIAGSKRSNTFARIFMYLIIHAYLYQVPEQITTTIETFVDDLAQLVYGRLNMIIPQAVHVIKLLWKLLVSSSLKISAKTTIVSSNRAAAREVASQLQGAALVCKSDCSVRDLGVDAGGGKLRTVSVHRGHIAKVKLKASGMRRFKRFLGAVASHKVSKLWTTKLWPTGEYGAVAYGLSKASLATMRSVAASAVSTNHGRCVGTTVAIGISTSKEHLYLFLRQAMNFHLTTWANSDDEFRSRISFCWKRTLSRLAIASSKNVMSANLIRGPLGALVFWLKTIGWKVPQPDRWISPDPHDSNFEVVHSFDGTGNNADLHECLEYAIYRYHGDEMCKHHSGSGAHKNIVCGEVASHWKRLLKPERTQEAGQFLPLPQVLAGQDSEL